MARKKNRVVIVFSPVLRRGLWASLDLLSFVKPSLVPTIDSTAKGALCDLLFDLDGDPRSVKLSLDAKTHRICAIALKYAQLYITGVREVFDLPVHPRLVTEIEEFSDAIKEMSNQF